MSNILVTGAAGYIGSQTCKLLKILGHTVYAVDRHNVKHKYWDQFTMCDYATLGNQFENTTIDAVFHIAANSLVEPSMTNPAMYYNNNIAGSLSFIDWCRTRDIDKFVFASSAACYGEPAGEFCTIEDGNMPINPYGWTKRMLEVILADYARAYNIKSVSLRFFNVAGADGECEMGQEKAATHIIPRIIERTLAGEIFTMNGGDYDTPDGTCIRDYVHVEDIANGFVSSLKYLETNCGAHVFNLGSGGGYSNLDIVNAVNRSTPLDVNLMYGPRRAGDPAKLVADTEPTKKLGWKPEHDLDSIVKTAYNWYIKQNKGT